MIALFALPSAYLVATLGYYAMLMGPHASLGNTAPVETPLLASTTGTGSVAGDTSVRCLLVPASFCHTTLYDNGPTETEGYPSQDPALVMPNGPVLPINNPYSGTFVSFPLR